jgi:hypothetical protein
MATLRFGADGCLRWGKLARGIDAIDSFSGATATADGRSLIFGQTEDFVNAGSGPTYVKRALEPSTAIVQYDAAGTTSLVRIMDGVLTDAALAPNGDIYVGLAGIVNFDSPSAPGTTAVGPGIAKLDSSGNFVWSRSIVVPAGPMLAVGPPGVLAAATGFMALFAP